MEITYGFFSKLERTGTSVLNFEYKANIVETTKTGFLWWKKYEVKTKELCRTYGMSWFFVDTGKYCPEQFKELERAYRVASGLPSIEHW